MARRIVMLGAPASGKGTQAARLAAHFELPNLSTGALIRSEQSRGSKLGRLADRHLAGGGFLPDDLIVEVMQRWLDEHGAEGFVLDGFPRTVPQAESFDRTLAAAGHRVDAVVLLEADEATLRDRCAKRVHCSLCGGTFQVESPRIVAGGQCPDEGCDGVLTPRPDDEPQTYAGRLANYQSLTEPLIYYYSEHATLKVLDGCGQPETVFHQILAELGDPVATTQTQTS